MRRVVLVGAGVVLVLAGVIFTLQGVGVLGGSVMSGVTFWAAAGPVIALAGLALAAIGVRNRTDSRPRLSAPGPHHRAPREWGTRVAALPSWSPLDHLASGLRALPIAP